MSEFTPADNRTLAEKLAAFEEVFELLEGASGYVKEMQAEVSSGTLSPEDFESSRGRVRENLVEQSAPLVESLQNGEIQFIELPESIRNSLLEFTIITLVVPTPAPTPREVKATIDAERFRQQEYLPKALELDMVASFFTRKELEPVEKIIALAREAEESGVDTSSQIDREDMVKIITAMRRYGFGADQMPREFIAAITRFHQVDFFEKMLERDELPEGSTLEKIGDKIRLLDTAESARFMNLLHRILQVQEGGRLFETGSQLLRVSPGEIENMKIHDLMNRAGMSVHDLGPRLEAALENLGLTHFFSAPALSERPRKTEAKPIDQEQQQILDDIKDVSDWLRAQKPPDADLTALCNEIIDLCKKKGLVLEDFCEASLARDIWSFSNRIRPKN